MNNPIISYGYTTWYSIIALMCVIVIVIAVGMVKSIILFKKRKAWGDEEKTTITLFSILLVIFIAISSYVLTVMLPQPTEAYVQQETELFVKNLAITPFEESNINDIRLLSEKEKKDYVKYQSFYLREEIEAETDFVEVTIENDDWMFPKKMHVYMTYADVKKPKVRYQYHENQYYNAELILPIEMEEKLSQKNIQK